MNRRRSLGRRSRGLGSSRLFRDFLFAGRENRVERGPFHTRHELDGSGVPYVLNKAVDDVVAQLTMRHLTTLETQRSLHLIAIAKKTHSLVLFGLVVVLVDGNRKLDFFYGDNLLLFARSALALVLLVQVLAVVLNAANGRDGVWRDLNQVQATFTGNFQGFKRGKDAELVAGFVDDADFTRADSFVNTDELLGRTLVDGFPPKCMARGPRCYSV
jgi:hypothetical protein